MSQLFRVNVRQTRTSAFYVEADSMESAREDAGELADGLEDGDWFDVDLEWDIEASDDPDREGVFVWTGGPSGESLSIEDWITSKTAKRKDANDA